MDPVWDPPRAVGEGAARLSARGFDHSQYSVVQPDIC